MTSFTSFSINLHSFNPEMIILLRELESYKNTNEAVANAGLNRQYHRSGFRTSYRNVPGNCLDIPQNFLSSSPDMWNNDNDYIIGQRKVRSLKVVNDAADKGVALIQEFNRVVTNDEDQKEYLLQVIEKHRKDFPNPKKSTIIAARRK
ncbi:hypothetical protein HELRODRAFT_174506 [Helobdella robusta]|uniref:Uncharacterized protein n=1 Tax=Helobdella robusta TaxID=6412 RepID=T1F872_HELRO|nr:hypothetical protein HELRODRAFT_174506 [Helobdella robusta]ESO01544.1 hypothetical protein HELRODRAFT_174506 [Helobdella robusta]